MLRRHVSPALRVEISSLGILGPASTGTPDPWLWVGSTADVSAPGNDPGNRQGELNEFDLNVFFSAEGIGERAKFKYEDEVQKCLDLIRGALPPSPEKQRAC